MKIILARIDDRLIHGQVVTRWLKEIDIDRIIIVNDEIYSDNLRKSIILKTSPSNIKTNIINVNKMIIAFNNIKYLNEKVMLLFTNPFDVLNLLNNNIKIKNLNIGGMSYKHNKIKLTNFIYVNNDDIKSFIKINNLGVYLDARMVSSDNKLDLMSIINNIKNNLN